jgi:hypothetical protein
MANIGHGVPMEARTQTLQNCATAFMREYRAAADLLEREAGHRNWKLTLAGNNEDLFLQTRCGLNYRLGRVDIDWQPHPTDNRRVVVEASAEMLPIEQVMGHLKDHFRLVGGRKVLFAPNGTAIKAVGA